MSDTPRVAAAEVPALRRELAAWHSGQLAAEYYTLMIRAGRQLVRPSGPAHVVGPLLAAAEARRLAEADLWYLDEGLCELLQAATPTMPRFAPVPQDLPSESGFCVFARPLAERDHRGDVGGVEAALAPLGDEVKAAAARLAGIPIEIGAVSWGPLGADPARAPAGGVWMSFWAWSRLGQVVDDPDALRHARANLGPMTVDNEAAVPWCPPTADPERWLLPTPTEQATTWGWAAATLAAFRLATQTNLAASTTERAPRPERRRTQRAGLPERDVHVVRLRTRGTGGPAAGEPAREYHHRWVVRGHWRQQPWGPRGSLRRPVWILPHVKGPDGAPLLGGERVTVVGAPPQEDGSHG